MKSSPAIKGRCLCDDTTAAAQLSCVVAEKLPWIEIADNLPPYLHGKGNASPVSYGPRASAEHTNRVSKRKQR